MSSAINSLTFLLTLGYLLLDNGSLCSAQVHVSIIRVDPDMPFYCQLCSCRVTNTSFITNCSHIGLFKPPKDPLSNATTELYLNDNNIKTLKYDYFSGCIHMRVLDLSRNVITSIKPGTFKDLISLEWLYLNNQKGTIIAPQAAFRAGAFQGLAALKVLHMHGNIDIRDVHTADIPTQALMDVENLEELALDGVTNIKFGEAFTALKNLTTIYMSGVSGTCEVGILSRNSFVGIPNIRNITLEKCRISTIGTGTFWSTPLLEYFDISDNYDLEINQFGEAAYELRYTKLKVLKINSIHNPNRAGTEILREDIRHIRDLELTELHMDNNGIEYVDYGVFSRLPKTLTHLYMRKNKLRFGIYLSEVVFNNVNLEVFDASDQVTVDRLDRMPFSELKTRLIDGFDRKRRAISPNYNQHGALLAQVRNGIPYNSDLQSETVELGRVKRDTPRVKLALKFLYCTGSHSDLWIKTVLNFTDTDNVIKVLDLSRNFMQIVGRSSFDGLGHVTLLNLSSNYIEHFTNDIFAGLDSVEDLDLSNNLFGNMLKQDVGGEIFATLPRLKQLLLANNRIDYLPEGVFSNALNIEVLDLSENYIASLNINIHSLKRLNSIKLANNRLQTIAPDLRSSLQTFSTQRVMHVDLRGNKLACNCDNIPFLQWLFKTGIRFMDQNLYYCQFNNDSLLAFNGSNHEFMEQLEEECRSYVEVIIAASTVLSFVAAMLSCVVVYHNRWKLRYLYYMAKVKMHRDGALDHQPDAQFMFDIFLSYADGDRNFVAKEMIEMLEMEHGLRLNIRDRDFEIGEMIAVNISKAIKHSKRTFLLVSRHFLQNKWCSFEMNIARMEAIYKQRDVVVVLFLETIPAAVLPLELIDLLRERPALELPKNENLRFPFWQKCKEYATDG